MRKLYAFLFTAFVLFLIGTQTATAQNYTFTTSAGNPIVPGTALVAGSQGDDQTVNIPIPFTYQAYGVNYTSVNASTNGNLQFTTTNAAFTNTCPLPTATNLGAVFMPHWDDLHTGRNAGDGIYTSVSGVAPNRIFNIEWRGEYFSPSGTPINFEARLFEGLQRVDYIYGNVPNTGVSASVGMQAAVAPTTFFTSFSCNASSLSNGLRISFVLAPPNDDCTGAIPINCGQTINSTTVGAAVDAVAACVTTLNTAPGVWYTFVGDGTNVTLSLCGSAYDTKIGVFSGSCGSLTCVTGNDDFCGLQSQVTFPTVFGTNYYILVTGFSTNTGAFSLTRTCVLPCSGVPSPGLISGPAGTICSGTPVVLSLSGYSSGTGLTFQWRSSATPGGPYTAIPGATTPNYAFNAGTTTYYICTVTCSNSGLSANTTEFALNVSRLVHSNVIATPSTTCSPGSTLITGTVSGGVVGANIVLASSGTINLAIPDANPAGVNSVLVVPAASIQTANALKIRINANHTWVGDLKFRLTSPCGITFLFDQPGVPASTFGNSDNLGTNNSATPPPAVYTFDLAAATVIPETSTAGGFIPAGSYKPSDVNGAAHNWAGLTFPCATAGNWTLNVSDNAGGDVGSLVDWAILRDANYTHTLTGPGTITQNPPTGAFNANASFNVTNIPAGAQVFVLTSTDALGCSVSTNVPVTVNPTPVVAIATAISGTCSENFDGAAAPALPVNWRADVGATCGGSVRWATVNSSSVSAPNSAFTNDPNCISDEYLYSKLYIITAASQISFSRNNNLESGFDGMVLEISMNGSPFQDIIAAGGSFVAGAYNGTISSSFGSPIAGRQAWTGNSGGYVTTTINLPAAAVGQNVMFRWRRATDNSVGATGVNIDDVTVTNGNCGNTVCAGTIVRIDAVANPPVQQTFTQLLNTHVPIGGNTSGIASPYPNTLAVSGLPFGASVKSVTLGTYFHSLPDDVDVVLVSPTGQAVILMSDCGGNTPTTGQTYVLDDAAASNLADAAFNASGTYKPTNYDNADNWPAPGPLAAPTSTTLSTFTGNMNGTWNLYAVDDNTGNIGVISTWAITFNVPPPMVFSPITNLYTDPAATIAYTGQPAYTVYARTVAPPPTVTYTASYTSPNNCASSASVTINVNQLPSIVTQPVAFANPVCPGFTINYSVTAAGTGITYQWQVSTDNGNTWTDLTTNALYANTTTNTLTIFSVPTTINNYRYRCVVTGTCAPPAISNSVTLVVATPPTITSLTTTPATPTICVNGNISFTVAATGVPAPTIYQWEVSTDGGATWNPLTTGGSYTPTFTITGATIAMNNNRYRVKVTNSCNQTTISSVVTLTVNALPVVSVTPITNRVCLTDSLIQLVGTPVGGVWSGLGVSGTNFIPTATAVGVYTLTYTYTNINNCTASASTTVKVEDCPDRIRLLRNDAVILFPNPNGGKFNIRINSTLYNYLGMRVFNPAGQLLKVQTFSGLSYGRVVPIDISNLPGGTYLVKFYYDDGIRTSEKTFTVVVQR